nr:putative reverse transcriptase domain-containing protein [Tanacetum cinerariifolium]
MNYFESNPCYDSNYFSFDQIKPPQYLVNQPLNIQNKPDAHELFISKLIQQKLQNEYSQPFSAIAITLDLPTVKPEDSLRMGDEHLDTIPETESDEFIKFSVENLVPNPSESEDLSDSECDVPVCDDFTTFSNLLFDADDNFSSCDSELFSDEDISKKIYSNPLFDEEIISMKIDPHHFTIAITIDLPTVEPKDSLRMGDEHLDTIPETNSDEFIKSSVKNLVPSPSESEDLSDSEFDVPVCDDFTTFSNLLIDADDDFSSSDDESFSDIDSLLDEFAGELILIDNTDCDHEEEIRLIKKLLYDNSSSQIDLSFTPDDSMPPDIEEDDYDCERDILILEELLSNDSILLPENESFHFDIPSSSHPPAKPLDNDSGTLTVKVMGDISEQRLKAFHLPSESPIMIYGGNTPILDETTDKVVVIKEKLQAARDRQKSYAKSERKMTEYEGKSAPRYVGPFEILERIGPVAYRLRLSKELIGVHDTFHVSNLKKCLADANFHVPLNEIKIDKILRFVEEPIEIIDREVKSLKRSRIPLVKVRWTQTVVSSSLRNVKTI